MQIHVTEEARHLCFARHYLKEHAPRLGPVRRFILSRRAPFILAIMAQMMMRPSSQIVRTYGIPRAVIREAYTWNHVHRARTLEALRKVRELCAEIGILTPGATLVWKLLGVWEPPAAMAAA
jgi:P-aminobenzoate N-oxygenase AurF